MAELVTREELAEALGEMLGYADARNCDPRARTVNMKFSRPTLEMWQNKARDILTRLDAETQEPRHAPEPEDAVDAAILRRAANVFRLGRLT